MKVLDIVLDIVHVVVDDNVILRLPLADHTKDFFQINVALEFDRRIIAVSKLANGRVNETRIANNLSHLWKMMSTCRDA